MNATMFKDLLNLLLFAKSETVHHSILQGVYFITRYSNVFGI